MELLGPGFEKISYSLLFSIPIVLDGGLEVDMDKLRPFGRHPL
jgi:hypothetical protein